MKRRRLFGILAAMLLLLCSTLRAADCVSVGVELSPEVMAGDLGRGSFELTNCGDVAGTVVLSFALQIPNGPTIEVADVPLKVGAGETIAHSFTYPAPHFLSGYTFGLCVTAVLGESSASDCVTTVISDSGGSSGGREGGFGVAFALEDDCLEIDLEITDVIYTSPHDNMADAYFELTNCGDQDADVNLRLEVTGYDLSGATNLPVQVGAGETVSRQWAFAVPSFIPSGTYLVCVTATAGSALVTDCESVEVLSMPPAADGDLPIDSAFNYPNPFNPSTQISFGLRNDSRVSVQIVNLLGQRIRVLIDEQTMAAGEQQVVWDGRDDAGQTVSSGLYFYRIVADDQTVSEKMVLVK
jgi:hypothetical protein